MALGILYDETTGQSYDPSNDPMAPPAPVSQTPTDSYDPTKASPTTGIGGNGGAQQTQYPPPPAASGGGGSSRSGVPPGYDPTKWNDPTHTSAKYVVGRIIYGGGSIGQAAAAVGGKAIGKDKIQLPDGTVVDVVIDEEGSHMPAWYPQNGGGGASDGSGGGTTNLNPFPSAQTGNQFDDPVTKEWETMLRQLVDRLNTPQPMWSNSQLDLMQTQALDPLERQRQAEKQQVTQQLAARGITPGSGPFIAALQDVDRRFDQLRTQTQSGFATNAVGREDQLFTSNENRNVNAVNMFKQIPQYADTRLQLAMNALTPSNPYQLLQLQNQIQQQGVTNSQYQDAQSQAYWAQLAQVLAQAFQ